MKKKMLRGEIADDKQEEEKEAEDVANDGDDIQIDTSK